MLLQAVLIGQKDRREEGAWVALRDPGLAISYHPHLYLDRLDLVAPAAREIHELRITTTRHCSVGCRFCDFRIPGSPEKREPVGLSTIKDQLLSILGSLPESTDGLITLRGGLALQQPFSYFSALIRTIRKAVTWPIRAFSPLEIFFFHEREHRPLHELLAELEWAGVSSLGPGGGEILVEEVRQMIAPTRIPTKTWCAVVEMAHRVGMNASGSLLVSDELISSEVLKEHLSILRALPISQIELKPLRPRNTSLNLVPPPNILELVAAVQQLKTEMHLPIYVCSQSIGPDGRTLLAHSGIDGFFHVAGEIEL